MVVDCPSFGITLEKPVRRLNFLDGLRGWGAVIVLLYHVFCNGLPVNRLFANYLSYLVPLNGMLAVLVFFVVSGFSLSVRFLADGDFHSWAKIVFGRYLRLTIPIFVSCLAVHLLMIFGFLANANDRLPVFRDALNFDPTVNHLLRFSFFDVFFNYSLNDTYIGPLWTMGVELWGSFAVLLTVAIIRPLPGRLFFLVALVWVILLLAPTETTAMLALFPAGAVLADCFNRGWIDATPKWVAIAFLTIGCLAAVVFPYTVTMWGLVGAWCLTLGCVALPETRSWLGNAFSTYLGRISFPLYIVHGPVLWFVGEPLTRHFGDELALKILIQLAVIVVSLVTAYVFLPVNEFAIRLAHAFAKSAASLLLVSSSSAER